jgi:dTDP-4-dehydrorhamnose reductase
MSTQKILITGSNGLLGQKLLALLGQDENIQIIATSRGTPRAPLPANAVYISLDVSRADEVEKVVKLHRPDAIIHTAAKTQVDECELNPQDCYLQNVEAVRNVAQAAAQMGAFLLHLSTDFIFDGTAGPYKEEDTPNPISVYGKSKLEAEILIQSIKGLQWAIARTVLVYGYSPTLSRSNIVLWAMEALAQGKPIKVVDDQWRTPTLAEDLADGCARIVAQRAGGIWHLSGKELMTPYEMVLRIARYFGYPTDTVERADASSFTQPAKRPPKTGFIIDKAMTQLGYQPHSFEKGLALIHKQMQRENISKDV